MAMFLMFSWRMGPLIQRSWTEPSSSTGGWFFSTYGTLQQRRHLSGRRGVGPRETITSALSVNEREGRVAAIAALAKLEGARIAIDLTDAWDEAAAVNGSDAQLITGVMVCRREFAESQPAAMDELLRAYATSVDFVNGDPATAAELIGAAGIVDAAIAQRAIPYCHIVCVTGDEMRSGLEGYLETLYDADPASVGGALPESDFYYRA